jgi:hypothetical protein
MQIEMSILRDRKMIGRINLEDRNGLPVPYIGDKIHFDGGYVKVLERDFYFFGPIQRVTLHCENVESKEKLNLFCAPGRSFVLNKGGGDPDALALNRSVPPDLFKPPPWAEKK